MNGSIGKDAVCIVGAVRTPIGSFNGSLSSLKGHELGTIVIKAVLNRTGIEAKDVSEVILGQVLTAGEGQNPARQASVNSGVPIEVPAWCVNMLCGSGLKSVCLGWQSINNGDAEIVIAGGQECMSQAPHILHMRDGYKMGDATLKDSMLVDGLLDNMVHCHMGITAENLVKQFGITRVEQDEFSAASQAKAAQAQEVGHFFREIIPVSIPSKKGAIVVDKDEYPRASTTADGLSKLKPCFLLDGSGSVTPGNSSGLNDGAACVLLMRESEANRRGLTPLVTLVSWAQAGVDPKIMGYGPVPAVRKAVTKAGWSLDEVDLFELNEAFAAQSLAVIKELGIDKNKVNVSGGAIALGHPLGASGARCLTTLIHGMIRTNVSKGVVALCIGGGMGVAMCVERTR